MLSVKVKKVKVRIALWINPWQSYGVAPAISVKMLRAAKDAQAEAESGGDFGVRGDGEDGAGAQTVQEDQLRRSQGPESSRV